MTDNQLKPTDEKSNEKSLSQISNEEVISESPTIEETEQQLVDDVDVAVADDKEEKITDQAAETITTEIPRTTEAESYYQNKMADRDETQRLIEISERELADLKLRKALMESNFENLLKEYQRLIIPQVDISVIAKKTLLEYFSYELLQPLHSVGLQQTNSYDIWQSKHFLIKYSLDNNENLMLSFKMNPIDPRFTTDFMHLMTVKPGSMVVTVEDDQVLELIRLWYVERVFSLNQLSLINFDLNQLLAHVRELGFTVEPSLLDNAQPLQVPLESTFSLDGAVLDDIFITTMENPDYDFEQQTEGRYRVLLDQGQTITISDGQAHQTNLFIDSNNRRRSLLDFFTTYPFLVPLMVRQN